MNIPPWSILKLPQVCCSAQALFQVARAMRMTGFSIGGSDTGLRRGQVLFTSDNDELRIAAAWHWAEWSASVVCIEDPCAIVANVTLVDDDGAELSWGERIANLNSLIYLLPWQHQVMTRMNADVALPIAA